MQHAGVLVAGTSFSAGLTSATLFSLNAILWGLITAWAGSILALIGFLLIVWALKPEPTDREEPVARPARAAEPLRAAA